MFRKMMIAALLAFSPVLAFSQDPMTERPNSPAPLVKPMPAPQKNASRQVSPMIQQKAVTVPGSMWGGSEQINNTGRLAFGLGKDGRAVMLDANSIVKGTWARHGDDIVIRFDNCVYRGKIQGNVFSGRGTFTTGTQAGVSWTFRVQHDDPYRGREFRGRENLNGFGPVSFRFGNNGAVQMIDARATVNGTYSMDMNVVTMRFGNCVYVGTLRNNGITGVARYTTGAPGNLWTFTVNLAR
ncbi:MAG: hypothetical protein HYX68_23115 [Planctomycetes bacterium]|nr:hypothetical protein [Planctomycetota bacterium]